MQDDDRVGSRKDRRAPVAYAATLRELGERALGPDERAEEQLIALDKRIQNLQNQRDEIATERENRELRRRMQRQIILGYGLIQRAGDGDPAAGRLVREIVGGLHRDGDRRAFEGWPMPGEEPAS